MNDFSAREQKDAIVEHFDEYEMSTENVEILGTDGENANTGWRVSCRLQLFQCNSAESTLSLRSVNYSTQKN